MHEALSRSCPTPRRSELSLADVAEIFVNRAPRTDLTIGKDKVVKLNNVTIRTSVSNLTAVFACGLTVQSTLVLQSMTVETLLTSDYEGRINGKSFEKAETVFWVDKSLAEPAGRAKKKQQNFVSAPNVCFTGLLGNNDKDKNNDLRNRDGSKQLPLTASEEELFPVASTCEL